MYIVYKFYAKKKKNIKIKTKPKPKSIYYCEICTICTYMRILCMVNREGARGINIRKYIASLAVLVPIHSNMSHVCTVHTLGVLYMINVCNHCCKCFIHNNYHFFFIRRFLYYIIKYKQTKCILTP